MVAAFMVAGAILVPSAALADDSPSTTPSSEDVTTSEVTTTEVVDDVVVSEETVTTEEEVVTDDSATDATDSSSNNETSEADTATEPADDSSAEVAPPAPLTETTQPVCVSTYTRTYTIAKSGDGFTSGTMTASAEGAAEGTPLCTPFFTNAVSWVFEEANTQFPQMKVADNLLQINAIGTFTVNFTYVKCGQYDWYGSDVSEAAVIPPQRLLGPSNPWQEIFVSSFAKGPTPYHVTSTYGCEGIPELPKDTVTVEEEDEEVVCGAEYVTTIRTVTTTTHELVFENGEYVIHSASSVRTEKGTRPLTPEEIESCIPMDAVAHVEFGQAATCDAASTINPVIANATWRDEFETEPGTYTNVAIADAGHHFPGDAENPGGYESLSFVYVIDAATGVQSTDSNAPCYVAPPEQPKHEEPKKPVVVQAGLAATGGELPIVGMMTALALLIGGSVLFIRRRKEASAQASK